jgi:hypothetical protein
MGMEEDGSDGLQFLFKGKLGIGRSRRLLRGRHVVLEIGKGFEDLGHDALAIGKDDSSYEGKDRDNET